MALTVAITKRQSIGAEWEVSADVTWDSSYATGGLGLTGTTLGLTATPRSVHGNPKSGYVFEYDYSNQKLKAFVSGHDMKAIGGLTSSEALFLDASQSFGKQAATDRTVVGSTAATTGGVLASALVEVASGTDLSSTPGTIKVTARGL